MDFPIDVPIGLVYVLAAAFWAAVLFQFILRQQRESRIREHEVCPGCKQKNLVVESHIVNRRNGRRVGLLKNVWGASMCLALAGVLLWSGALVATDLLTGSDATGIQGDNWKVVLGLLVLTLGGGSFSAVASVRLLSDYLVGGRTTVVDMKCSDCGVAWVLE
ncbi:MAG: hypothetical protein OEV43_08225 [Coriobacteriia bacterium]|nr:hypothetical protein [Coriobacteriia bacterium]